MWEHIDKLLAGQISTREFYEFLQEQDEDDPLVSQIDLLYSEHTGGYLHLTELLQEIALLK